MFVLRPPSVTRQSRALRLNAYIVATNFVVHTYGRLAQTLLLLGHGEFAKWCTEVGGELGAERGGLHETIRAGTLFSIFLSAFPLFSPCRRTHLVPFSPHLSTHSPDPVQHRSRRNRPPSGRWILQGTSHRVTRYVVSTSQGVESKDTAGTVLEHAKNITTVPHLLCRVAGCVWQGGGHAEP